MSVETGQERCELDLILVYAGVRGAHRAEAAKLGADVVVALDDDRDVAQLPTLDAVADTVGGETVQKLLAKVKRGGTIVSVVGPTPGAEAHGLVVRAFMHTDGKRLREMGIAVAAGKLVVPIARRFPLAEAGAAQKLAEKSAGGKVLLTTV